MNQHEANYRDKLKNDLNGEYELLGEYTNSSTPTRHKHNTCDYEWDVAPTRVIQHRPCPKCSGKLRKTTDEFKQEINNLVGEEYELLGEYKNNKTKVLMKHKTCGNKYKVRPDLFLNGNRCPVCSAGRKQHDIFVDEIEKLVGNEYTVLGEYVKNSEKVLMKHEICGHEWDVSPTHFLSGIRCPYCSNRKTIEVFKDQTYSLVGDEYTVLGEYENNKTPIKMKHNTCNFEWDVLPTNFITRNARCPKCAGVLKKTTNEFKEEVKNLTNTDYIVLGNYINTKTKVLMKHVECGNEYEVTRDDFIRGRRCPKCAKAGISLLEVEVSDYIKEIYDGKIMLNDRTLLDNYEVDIYLPELNIGIEFNGLYWHSEQNGKDRNYHLNKTNILNEKDIRLIHIFEDEWLNKKEIVKSKIEHILKLSKKPAIYARKCEIKEVPANIKNEFLDKNHIQGRDSSKYKFGLYYNNELVSVMTFGALRVSLGSKGEKNSYELIRYANNINYRVVGGFSKLLKYFTKNYEYNIIKTFADLRWSESSNVYEVTGFELSHKSKPNYWYFKPNDNIKTRLHRYVFRKQQLKKKFPDIYDDELTEIQIMEEAGYHRIWDCGNLVYEMKNND